MKEQEDCCCGRDTDPGGGGATILPFPRPVATPRPVEGPTSVHRRGPGVVLLRPRHDPAPTDPRAKPLDPRSNIPPDPVWQRPDAVAARADGGGACTFFRGSDGTLVPLG